MLRKDNELAKNLSNKFNINLLSLQDVLKIDETTLFKKCKGIWNLPYNISTEILVNGLLI